MTLEAYSAFPSILCDRPAPGVLRLTLNRPESLNSLGADAHRELADIWRVVDRDRETLAVLLCAKGKAFSAGGDFEVVKKLTQSFEERANMWREARDLVYNIVNCSKPIVSAIQGAAVGAGLAAALVSDIPIAAKNAKLVDGHVRLGVAAGDHAAIIWPLLCGMAKAKYHLLLNEPVSGEKAEQLGLVALAVDEEELQEKALAVASRLAEGAPSAIQWTKYALNNWLRMAGPTFDASLALEMLGFSGPDPQEGLDSFRERRAPNFPKKAPF
ncbi:enoyl-CoA hydratase/isomerase family protein [Bosea sp. (in: a-proteobacteria)]|jgi:enoyl-CoA hydratase|uniref:enoyl-CoA hydratase/isomerase family protein n=1 Tax=Bosea sp. (in: a-proteobacteria) TaxID=1871050 RepID=UPI0011FC6A99|nr:enoyl-CoA hydratase/isomerase family protein [Bosea sp. (in: a-proteobacteria)]TAJ30059.1 MAG: enoyl-CoA hydratase/isomerase family protein [Bosea sp. (in: a-proteobacteria)]